MQSRHLFALVSLIAAVVASPAVSLADGSNTLIGQWRLSQQIKDPNYESMYCTRTQLAFTPDKFGWVIDGKLTVEPVSGYTEADGRIFVHMANEEAFTVVDQNTIKGIELMTTCIYTRTR